MVRKIFFFFEKCSLYNFNSNNVLCDICDSHSRDSSFAKQTDKQALAPNRVMCAQHVVCVHVYICECVHEII